MKAIVRTRKPNDARTLISVELAAKRLSIGRSLAYQLVATGELRSIKIGARRLVPVNELDMFVTRRLNTASDS